ncbi:conserved rodent malaria protein, unknown function [Plasmodium berghei]|uniref:Fam-d protein n=2 Tax=Plasmodium berghei TaxID=5821 RepID=A0A509AJ84_PLABA|nr:conserved rodent malaria protein, unknown function [Plasmodium berghei ANKA]CXI37475.1 conserved rodent malaria protein, unknown function [Plasmodium berghei]SCM21672.1 conserved rodent malaria protein, unknown function [Plasmodium berghei]SCN24871.1 conserved rodent malaria protein, unknown function [Plasmodium berghei]SCO59985.1 conserved rodent malaria protein, unknown function [Plasmodium berghei]SCO61376.1 conserved rodent malaria protein, unknown function [Plasmodium berghei]|eukprot:XP_034421339.1 conserved rodent malaria protein, unknown function [Plasmodium berghei ANKA]
MFKFLLPTTLLATFVYCSEPGLNNSSHKVRISAGLNEPDEDYTQHLYDINQILAEENRNDFDNTISKEGYSFIITDWHVSINNGSRPVQRMIFNPQNKFILASAIRQYKLITMIKLYELNIFNYRLNRELNYKESDFGSVMNRFANELKDIFLKKNRFILSSALREVYRCLHIITYNSTIRVSGLVIKRKVAKHLQYPLSFKFDITFGKKRESHIHLESYTF